MALLALQGSPGKHTLFSNSGAERLSLRERETERREIESLCSGSQPRDLPGSLETPVPGAHPQGS